ncbi:MAG: hypothetical protein ACQGVC_23870 [Myxococcota bacterium]
MRLPILMILLCVLVAGGCATPSRMGGPAEAEESQDEGSPVRKIRGQLFAEAGEPVAPALSVRYEDMLGRLRDARFPDPVAHSIEIPAPSAVAVAALLRLDLHEI